jgi:transposase, IS30 family
VKYKHLTPEQRYTIDVLLQQKKSRKEICETIKISQSTLCRELKRNSGKYGYHCKQAQVKANDRKRRLQNYRNLTIELRAFIREKITTEQWSPAQVVGYLRKRGKQCVCVETIYAYIRADRAAGGDLWKHCRHQLKHRRRQVSQPYNAVQNRTMIDERPLEWDGSSPGDFEMDTIVGKDGKGAIVTLVERNSSFIMARKLSEGKNAEALAKTVINMLLPYIGKIRSITTDNGSEFAEHLLISKRLKTKIFFAHPYSSWEKGCIEYHNKLIRQYIPKGTDFNVISDHILKEIIVKINRRPRLKLGFSTPVAEFFKFIS